MEWGLGTPSPPRHKDKELPLTVGCLPFQKRARHDKEVSEPAFLRRRNQPGKVAGRGSPWLEVGLGLPDNAGQGRTSKECQPRISGLPPRCAQGPRCWRCSTLC